ncbi:GNAT family N-acetyltransferase [Alkalicella caledoniensis]|uniref:GNAT family N-acetyltransferase n=1 Tax=Alkalicella caledoniensis TaxID=2731377 RepID=A0A7G9W652_ALKCA|nr:N-acetyltransferase [Alkalicella caledoniensis]QNO14164.1 GNAT family N-acetyltransferase [Alkalicella caledoniensis]
MIKVIELAKNQHLDNCYRILMQSQLGEVYFADKSPMKMMQKGIENKEIYVCLNQQDEILGFLWVELSGTFDKYPYLHMIVIDENVRGKGIGKKLLSHFEEVITSDYDKVFLMVGDFNKRAKRLYEELDYKVVGMIPNFYKEGVTEYLMYKTKDTIE